MTKTWELVVVEQGYEDELQGEGTLAYVKRLKSELMVDYTDAEMGSQIGVSAPQFVIREV